MENPRKASIVTVANQADQDVGRQKRLQQDTNTGRPTPLGEPESGLPVMPSE
jgi:hypothetical protein